MQRLVRYFDFIFFFLSSLLRIFLARANATRQFGPKKFAYGQWYEQYGDQIYNLPVTKDDIWIVTLPRSGTTLTEELMWLINNDLDYETAKKIPLVERIPFLE